MVLVCFHHLCYLPHCQPHCATHGAHAQCLMLPALCARRHAAARVSVCRPQATTRDLDLRCRRCNRALSTASALLIISTFDSTQRKDANARAGVGKGRTLAGLILERHRCGVRRHVWVSVSPDLRHDAARDLRDLGAANIAVHSLVDLPAADRGGGAWPREGVMFASYSALTSGALFVDGVWHAGQGCGRRRASRSSRAALTSCSPHCILLRVTPVLPDEFCPM